MQKLIRKLPKRLANCELRTANSNPAVRLKIGENDRVNIITHLSDSEELFLGNKLFSNDKWGALYVHLFHVFVFCPRSSTTPLDLFTL